MEGKGFVMNKKVCSKKKGLQHLIGVIEKNLPQWRANMVCMADIARQAGVSCERVRQVMKSHFGLTKKNQVAYAAEAAELRRWEKREAWEREVFGDTLLALEFEFGVSLVKAFLPKYRDSQRNAVRIYGDKVWLTGFRDWLLALKASELPLNGDRRICLSRRDFAKPYQSGNLHFMLVTGTGDARKRRGVHEHADVSLAHINKGKT